MSALTAGTSRSLNLCWKSWVENISMLYQAWGLTSLEVFDDLAFQWSDTQVQRNQASGSLFRISYCCVWGQITWGAEHQYLESSWMSAMIFLLLSYNLISAIVQTEELWWGSLDCYVLKVERFEISPFSHTGLEVFLWKNSWHVIHFYKIVLV